MKSQVKAALAALLTVVAFTSAPSAAATPAQDQMLADMMADAGVYLYPAAYSYVYRICTDVWNGYNPEWVASNVWSANPQWTYAVSERFVAAAIVIYCPPSGYSAAKGWVA